MHVTQFALNRHLRQFMDRSHEMLCLAAHSLTGAYVKIPACHASARSVASFSRYSELEKKVGENPKRRPENFVSTVSELGRRCKQKSLGKNSRMIWRIGERWISPHSARLTVQRCFIAATMLRVAIPAGACESMAKYQPSSVLCDL
jgi:hypothetical protein